MSVHLKPIIPKKMKKVDATAEINAAIARTLQTGKTLFERTTRTWDTNVTFNISEPEGGRGAVGTDNDIYGYISRGTRPHLIKPVNAKVLVFGGAPYNPKTRKGILSSRGVGVGVAAASGVAAPVFARQVNHPGTQARGFEEQVAGQLQPILETNVAAAIAKSMGD